MIPKYARRKVRDVDMRGNGASGDRRNVGFGGQERIEWCRRVKGHLERAYLFVDVQFPEDLGRVEEVLIIDDSVYMKYVVSAIELRTNINCATRFIVRACTAS